jgi:excisionase family DNA binding protein
MAERISTEQAAERLGVSVRTVQRLAAAGKLPAERVSRDYTFDARDVELYRLRPQPSVVSEKG